MIIFLIFFSFFYSYFLLPTFHLFLYVSLLNPHTLSICLSLPPCRFAQAQLPQTHCHRPTLQLAITANPHSVVDPCSIAFYFSFFLYSSSTQLPCPTLSTHVDPSGFGGCGRWNCGSVCALLGLQMMFC